LIAVSGTASALRAQDGPQPSDGQRDGRGEDRPNLLAELGLSPEQVQQIRRMNQERRPTMMQAQRRMHEANQALDTAIYRDAVSDEEFQTRLKEVQTAQSDLARLRFENELAVRRVLTPDQLVRFREIRRRFEEQRQNEMRERRQQRRMGREGPAMRGEHPDHPALKNDHPPLKDQN
jgi:periplasmic protein CpxP/Spy